MRNDYWKIFAIYAAAAIGLAAIMTAATMSRNNGIITGQFFSWIISDVHPFLAFTAFAIPLLLLSALIPLITQTQVRLRHH